MKRVLERLKTIHFRVGQQELSKSSGLEKC